MADLSNPPVAGYSGPLIRSETMSYLALPFDLTRALIARLREFPGPQQKNGAVETGGSPSPAELVDIFGQLYTGAYIPGERGSSQVLSVDYGRVQQPPQDIIGAGMSVPAHLVMPESSMFPYNGPSHFYFQRKPSPIDTSSHDGYGVVGAGIDSLLGGNNSGPNENKAQQPTRLNGVLDFTPQQQKYLRN